jgi:hypothetical protein
MMIWGYFLMVPEQTPSGVFTRQVVAYDPCIRCRASLGVLSLFMDIFCHELQICFREGRWGVTRGRALCLQVRTLYVCIILPAYSWHGLAGARFVLALRWA